MAEPERVRVFLDPQPLVDEIHAWRQDGHLLKDLSQDARVPYRTIHRYMAGEVRHCRLDCADRLASALNVSLSALWPPIF